jgi:hypothetical protein
MQLKWSKINIDLEIKFANFAQKQVNRLINGHFRYGPPSVDKRFMSRMIKEIAKYKTDGNIEHLYNIANYAFLEKHYPEHNKQYEDNTVPSVTRGKI